jgi:hypothetical protein
MVYMLTCEVQNSITHPRIGFTVMLDENHFRIDR